MELKTTRENEKTTKILKKCNFEIEEILFKKIKLTREKNFITQRKLVNELLKLGLKEYEKIK